MGFLDRLFGRTSAPTGRPRPTYRNSAVIERIQKDEGVDALTATRMFEEMLVFLDLCAASEEVLSPSKPVDAAWHAFLLHTKDYENYCTQRFGKVIHHQPMDADPQAYARARHRREMSGYGYVDPYFWPVASGGYVASEAMDSTPIYGSAADDNAAVSGSDGSAGYFGGAFGSEAGDSGSSSGGDSGGSSGGDSGGGSSCGGGGGCGGSS